MKITRYHNLPIGTLLEDPTFGVKAFGVIVAKNVDYTTCFWTDCTPEVYTPFVTINEYIKILFRPKKT